MKFVPHKYQSIALEKIYATPKVGLLLDMGLGKTVITLTAIEELIYNRFEVGKVLVIAPLRVAEDTWSRESRKWDHLNGLRISKVLGTPTQRRKALAQDADIYIINRENVVWLTNELSCIGNAWDFDMVVIDELSSFKSSKAQRFRALKKYITRSKRVVGLTGTPAPNGLIDLWSQIYLLDGGERLGKTITGYRERYFLPDKRSQTTIFSYKPKAEAEKAIYDKISDICVSMSTEDWLGMPERIDNVQHVQLSAEELKLYEEFEKEKYLEFMQGAVPAAKGERVQTTPQNGSEDRFIAYAEYSRIIDERIDELYAVKCEIFKAISRIEDGTLRTLLELRYLSFKTWEEIAVEMSYSYVHVVHNLHPQALKKIKELIEFNTDSVV